MSKKKIIAFDKRHKACLVGRQGSILAYSLVIIAMMLAIATSLSVSAILSKKGASSTEYSMQSLQTADSGVQLALKELNDRAGDSATLIGTLGSSFGDCDNGKFTSVDGFAGPEGSKFELTFFKEDGVTKLSCNDKANEVRNIKSVGTYRDTVRAVSVAVAATATGGVVGGCVHNVAGNITDNWGVGCIITNTQPPIGQKCANVNSAGYACGISSVFGNGNEFVCLCIKS